MAIEGGVTPIDLEHEIGVDDYFFSTTDRKGIIEEANSVFSRLSQYDRERPDGTHVTVGRPEMHGSEFKLAWDQLKEGQPACAYVKNMAADGGTYWVFATLMPVGDKYLSVRMKPLATSVKNAPEGLYREVRPIELAARAAWEAGRGKPADAGLGMLVEGLAPLGVTSPDDLALTYLPMEVSAHERLSSGLPRRPYATGPLAELLAVMHGIDERTRSLVSQLEEYGSLVSSLEQSSRDAAPATERLRQFVRASQAGARVPGAPEMIQPFTARLTEHAAAASDRLSALDSTMSALAKDVRWLRMRIALLRLHNRMVGTFCAELIDGCSAADAVSSLQVLASALARGADELDISMRAVRVQMSKAPALIQQAVRDADRALRVATKWRGEAQLADGAAEIALRPHLHRLQQLSGEGFDELRRFYEVAARCAFLPDTYDHDGLSAQVRRMTEVVGQVAQTMPA